MGSSPGLDTASCYASADGAVPGLLNQVMGVRIPPEAPKFNAPLAQLVDAALSKGVCSPFESGVGYQTLNMFMRTDKQISSIKERIIDPYSVSNFISHSEVFELVKLFKEHSDKLIKNTGPITVNIAEYQDHPVIEKIFKQLEIIIGPFETTGAFWFSTDYPHIIHNDDSFELPENVYRGITIPLQVEGGLNLPYLCFFDQFYFHGPAKFFNGGVNFPEHYNKHVCDYSEIDGLISDSFIDHEKLFTHLDPKWLQGLSFHSKILWKPTTAIIFDSTRLHCASDFRKQGIKRKLGISIFTKKL